MPVPYRNRAEAGRFLAEKLAGYTRDPDLLVLAPPRGGVPVASEVARALGAPLDVFLVRKLGGPGHEELAMGASPPVACVSLRGPNFLKSNAHISGCKPHKVRASKGYFRTNLGGTLTWLRVSRQPPSHR